MVYVKVENNIHFKITKDYLYFCVSSLCTLFITGGVSFSSGLTANLEHSVLYGTVFCVYIATYLILSGDSLINYWPRVFHFSVHCNILVSFTLYFILILYIICVTPVLFSLENGSVFPCYFTIYNKFLCELPSFIIRRIRRHVSLKNSLRLRIR